MSKTLKFVSIVAWIVWLSWALLTICNADTDPNTLSTAEVQLTIEAGDLRIGINSGAQALNVSSWSALLKAKFEEQTASATFSDYFRIEDLKWSKTGYVTTVQVTDLTWTYEWTQYVIPWSNVKFTANSKTTLLWKNNSQVTVDTDLPIWTAQTYFQRANNTTAWILGKYWTKPTITVTIPAGTPGTTYRWTLTYTLTERTS